MNKWVLVDTSVWIFLLRKSPPESLVAEIEPYLQEDRIAVSDLIKLELLGGITNEMDFLRLKTRLDDLHQVEISKTVWEEAITLAFRLRGKGLTVPNADIIIASAAISAGALLLHADRHFDLIAKHSGLKVKNLSSKIPAARHLVD
ncbi:MAG: PIN domain-containing protein [Proteobacteria bacterium]|nr:PIN domain-containing protein [Pseudomonadota bacterium]